MGIEYNLFIYSIVTLYGCNLKIPICSFDAKTGILCPKCEMKLKGGQITLTDVEVSIKLTKLAEKTPELNKISLIKAMDISGNYVIILKAGDLMILRNDDLMMQVEGFLGKKTMFLEGDVSDRRMLEDLFYPIRILTVNVVWLPDGSKLSKVIIPGRKTERFPIDIELVKKVAKAVRSIDLLVEFER